MNLNCLKDIITNGLAIQIDLTDLRSWNLNTGFTSTSISQWKNVKVDNLNLLDFGLTAYDNGRINYIYNGITFAPKDINFTLYRVGYNNSFTPFSGQTQYDLYPISAVTSGLTGNYFLLDGGYLQGFFKLQDYSYELLPARYAKGLTIETLLYITPDSFNNGIFYMMGTRAEDKYNLFFSGETKEIITTKKIVTTSGVVSIPVTIITTTTGFSGVTTSQDNYLISYQNKEKIKPAFSSWEDRTILMPETKPMIDNLKNNVIAFFLDTDKKIGLKYIDENGIIVTKKSDHTIKYTGWTMINHTFRPYEIITEKQALCYPRRKGEFAIYVNGSLFWKIKDFDEYYFRGLYNDKEKQIGVPYSISWGGGSFGLKHSWHYDIEKHILYSGESQSYIEDNLEIINNPLVDNTCYTGDTGGTYNSFNIILTANTTTFYTIDECNPIIQIPKTVLEIKHTGNTGTTLTSYFIKFKNPIKVLSNRDYILTTKIYDTGIFKKYDKNNYFVYSSIKLAVYDTGNTVINVLSDIEYQKPLVITGNTTGENSWKTIQFKFQTEKNSEVQLVFAGILIESTLNLYDNFILYIDDFNYVASDKLNQDSTKNNLLIEQNFDTSFIGGIQKLRIYDYPFTQREALHNAEIELKNNPAYNYIISIGGRIIHKILD